MVQFVRASSVPDRFASTSGRRDRMPNTVDHRFAGNGAAYRNAGRNASRNVMIHRVAHRGVTLRRVAARRRLARIDPESVERRAWRLNGGSANSPTRP